MKDTPASLAAPGLEKALKQAEKNVTAVQKLIAEKEQAVQKAKEALWDIVDEKEKAIDTIEDQLAIARAAVADKQTVYDAAVTDNTSQEAIEAARVDLENAKKQVEALENELDDAKDDCDDARDAAKHPDSQDAVIAAQEEVTAAQESLAEANELLAQARTDLADGRKTDALTVKNRDRDISKAQNDLAVQRAKFKQFQATAGVNEIKADYAGRISKLSLAPGATINPNEAVAVIDDANAKYDLKATVPADQAKVLVIGDRADVSMGRAGWAQAILREIREDKDQPGVVRQLVFDVNGDVALGQQVTINIYKQGRNYDQIVPNAAIREDASGRFVLAMRQKSGPLGSRYTLERVSVTVLESDSTRSAISAALEYGMPIVTAANKPVAAGSRVLPTR
jgi:multidrug resistance efflux pump